MGKCYNKIQKENNITEDLIVVIINKIDNENNLTTTLYSFFDPKTGEILNAEICKNDSILLIENIISLLNENMSNFNAMLSLMKQGKEKNISICEEKSVETIENGECPENYPYLYKDTNKCKIECKIIDLFKEKCILNNFTIELEQKLINIIEEEIIAHSIEDLLNNIINDKGDDLRVELKGIKYHILSSLRQINKDYENISTINLGECENILKREYHIDKNKALIIFKVDLLINSSTIPVVIYEVFHPETKEKLNLTYCKGIKIDIIYPVNINEDELYKYNQSSNYYSDICWLTTSPDKTDITIKDRQEEYLII